MVEDLSGFIDFFKTVPDHRLDRRKIHKVEEILLVTFCGTIAGCDGWEDLELFGQTKLEYLRGYLEFEHGPPSDDTLRRFFRILDPEKFEECFTKWVKSFQLNLESKVVAIDGKTSRRSFDNATQAMHMVSAFASESGITLGQVKTQDKSNEITAIPELLEVLDIAGSIVTIDAMGCQTKIVDKILSKEADFLISLKGNQGNLNEDVRVAFEKRIRDIDYQQYKDLDKGHGRIEERVCTVLEDLDWLKERHPNWSQIKTIAEIRSTRIIKDKQTEEKRYYISSLTANPEKILNATREHWAIENKLHWVLDVCFGDDHSRIRKGNAPRNIAIVKKTALNLLQIVKKTKSRISLRRMRKLAGWETGFMHEILTAKF